jgi:hypothetical protein
MMLAKRGPKPVVGNTWLIVKLDGTMMDFNRLRVWSYEGSEKRIVNTTYGGSWKRTI